MEKERIKNWPAKLLRDLAIFFKKGDQVTVISYHHDFGGYMIKNSDGATNYVYPEDIELLP